MLKALNPKANVYEALEENNGSFEFALENKKPLTKKSKQHKYKWNEYPKLIANSSVVNHTEADKKIAGLIPIYALPLKYLSLKLFIFIDTRDYSISLFIL
ncbi:MAG TPA: hypothetical protein DCG42_01035 [Maribacter sp.]|nr:hypothetical protein [Maribacter sp.]|tara:strand:+ start:1331 stop:1630 length:300 start_codon:yes stop_codon:yes gene_type:complete